MFFLKGVHFLAYFWKFLFSPFFFDQTFSYHIIISFFFSFFFYFFQSQFFFQKIQNFDRFFPFLTSFEKKIAQPVFAIFRMLIKLITKKINIQLLPTEKV